MHPSTPELYPLSLHDALPIWSQRLLVVANLSRFAQPVELDLSAFKGMVPLELFGQSRFLPVGEGLYALTKDRKSTRLNSSHRCISYAVFCLKKKKKLKTLVDT